MVESRTRSLRVGTLGVPAPLLAVLRSAMQAELSSGFDLTDGQTFTFDLDIRPLADRRWASPNGELPAPTRAICEVRVYVDVEAVELTAFGGPAAVTAFAGVSAALDSQVTIVAVEGPDGGIGSQPRWTARRAFRRVLCLSTRLALVAPLAHANVLDPEFVDRGGATRSD